MWCYIYNMYMYMYAVTVLITYTFLGSSVHVNGESLSSPTVSVSYLMQVHGMQVESVRMLHSCQL